MYVQIKNPNDNNVPYKHIFNITEMENIFLYCLSKNCNK